MKPRSLTVAGIVQAAFIGLKLFNVVDWSWFWVLYPLWIALFIFVVTIIAVLTIKKM